MHRSTHRLTCSLIALLLGVATASQAVARDGPRGYYSRTGSSHAHSGYARSGYSHAGYSHAGYSRYHHRSYPRYGYGAHHWPRAYYSPRYYGSPYYYGSYWYRPFGIGVSVLPPFYTTVWFGGSPYYYADNTYYTYRPERREYVVTEPPRGEAKVESTEAGSGENFAYPRDGQSEDRQATDRNECHQWAVARAGYDPTRPAGNVAETDMTSRRADYRRAEAACLEARGYTVR